MGQAIDQQGHSKQGKGTAQVGDRLTHEEQPEITGRSPRMGQHGSIHSSFFPFTRRTLQAQPQRSSRLSSPILPSAQYCPRGLASSSCCRGFPGGSLLRVVLLPVFLLFALRQGVPPAETLPL